MLKEVLGTFDERYHSQVRSNFAKKFVDTSAGISKEQKHLNAIGMVKQFNQLFNRRETIEDRRQKRELATLSDQQFIDDTGTTPAGKNKNKKRTA